MFRSRPPEAITPMERSVDGLRSGAMWPSDPQPSRRDSFPGLWSSLVQDPELENRCAMELAYCVSQKLGKRNEKERIEFLYL